MCLDQLLIYTILELSPTCFKIQRYNVVTHETEILNGTYFTREDARLECNELNKEAAAPNP